MNRRLTLGLLLLWTGAVLAAAGVLQLAGRPAAAAFQSGTDPAFLQENLIRLHVVANSDSEADQALKRAVRDAIVAEVAPLFAGARTRAEAEAAIRPAMDRISEAAARVISKQGRQAYGVKTELGQFDFPARFYGELFVPAGRYTALRVALGEAQGANWWCVLFPPMCFLDWSTGVVLEPKPGSGGTQTVAVPRNLVVEERIPVKARFALLDWAKQRLQRKPAAGRIPR
ncbi:MAG TPA: stage II sporulation protein R [Symbiobacteriaceae bacterium]|nr:stage II sporulation protein R [Symbiobacteriaceae bacterium]